MSGMQVDHIDGEEMEGRETGQPFLKSGMYHRCPKGFTIPSAATIIRRKSLVFFSSVLAFGGNWVCVCVCAAVVRYAGENGYLEPCTLTSVPPPSQDPPLNWICKVQISTCPKRCTPDLKSHAWLKQLGCKL